MPRLTQTRPFGFLAVLVIYLLAAVLAMVLYPLFPGSFPVKLLLADISATVFVFCFSLVFRNASVYDPYWSVQPPVILTAYAIGTGLNLPRVLLLIAVWLWAIRLTANWAYTFHGFCHQDWRYTMLAEKTGKWYPFVNFLGIHLFPTLIVYACILPAVYAFSVDIPSDPLCVIGFVLCVSAVLLQLVSDIQMQKHRKEGSGTLIRRGLWKYARHPNYLGEILMWWGVALCAILPLGNYWYLFAGALANTLMFCFISIPMADKRQSKKEGYETYRRETRSLFPLPKKIR